MKLCKVTDCGRKVCARGMCQTHWKRWRETGVIGGRIKLKGGRGPDSLRWKGGRVRGPGGRWMVYCPDYPGPKVANVYVLEYRLEAEKKLGRRLKPTEVIHHPDDNPEVSGSKIEVIESQSIHALIHSKTRSRNAKGQFTS